VRAGNPAPVLPVAGIAVGQAGVHDQRAAWPQMVQEVAQRFLVVVPSQAQTLG